jgi:hypothetical protein
MKIEFDENEVLDLFHKTNIMLFLLEGEKDSNIRKQILDYLLENEDSPVKKLAKILKVII